MSFENTHEENTMERRSPKYKIGDKFIGAKNSRTSAMWWAEEYGTDSLTNRLIEIRDNERTDSYGYTIDGIPNKTGVKHLFWMQDYEVDMLHKLEKEK